MAVGVFTRHIQIILQHIIAAAAVKTGSGSTGHRQTSPRHTSAGKGAVSCSTHPPTICVPCACLPGEKDADLSLRVVQGAQAMIHSNHRSQGI